MNRTLAALALVLLSAAPALAQGDEVTRLKQENATLRTELEEQRALNNRLMDDLIESQRDADRLNHAREVALEELQAQLARTVRDAKLSAARLESRVAQLEERLGDAGGDDTPAHQADPLDARQITFDFPETPLDEVFQFLQDVTGFTFQVDAEALAECTTDLRVRNLPIRHALDLLCDNAKREGKRVELSWTRDGEAIRVE